MRVTKECFSEIKSQAFFITEIAELITGYFWRESRSYWYYVRRKNNRFTKQEFVSRFLHFNISVEHTEISQPAKCFLKT